MDTMVILTQRRITIQYVMDVSTQITQSKANNDMLVATTILHVQTGEMNKFMFTYYHA
jgi:hypothetical protein